MRECDVMGQNHCMRLYGVGVVRYGGHSVWFRMCDFYYIQILDFDSFEEE